MAKMLFLHVLVPGLTLICITSATCNGIENIEANRYIDISTQLVNVKTVIMIKNIFKNPIKSYIYTVDPQWVDHLSHIEVLDDNTNQLDILKVHKLNNSEDYSLQYEIVFKEPLPTDKTMQCTVSMVITNYLQSVPKIVKQNEKHTVLFSFNVYYYSMYFTQIQKTYIHIGSTKIAQIDGAMYNMSNDHNYGLQYGPYYKVDPFKNYQSVFHYEINSPFLVAETVKRYIKVSHWGYITVWDQIQIVNAGPKLKGPYERPPDTQNKGQVVYDTRVERFVSTLPEKAFDIYLKDDIGLIWTYDVREKLNKVDVFVRPRIILYGGWRTQYEIGYSVPISDYVLHDAGNYMLSFPVMDVIFNIMVIKEAEINIILPEQAEFISAESHFEMKNNTDIKYCYYFDVTCRDVISFEGQNLVEKHLANLKISYSFSQFSLLTKPLIIAAVLICAFLPLKMLFDSHAEPSKNKKVKSIHLLEASSNCKTNNCANSVTYTTKKKKRNTKPKQI